MNKFSSINPVGYAPSKIEWHDMPHNSVIVNIPEPKLELSDNLNGHATIIDEKILVTPIAALNAMRHYLNAQYAQFDGEQLGEQYETRVRNLLVALTEIYKNW